MLVFGDPDISSSRLLHPQDIILEVDGCQAREFVILTQEGRLHVEPLLAQNLVSKGSFVALAPLPEIRKHINRIVIERDGRRIVITP